MRFAFTDDQKMLRDTVREVLQRQCAPEVVRAAWEGRPDGVRAVWDTLADTGVIGMTASEEAGGMGMNELDLVLPLEETGYAALPGPVVDTAAVGIPLLEAAGTDEQKERWLGPAVAGEARIVVSFEDQDVVPHAASADVLLAERGGVAFCVPVGEASVIAEKSVDRPRELARVAFESGSQYRMRDDVDTRAQFVLGRERAALGAAAQLVGLSRRMLDMTVQYAKDREQFGKPIGAQQAVKHRLANALIEQEFARPLVYRAGWSMATGAADAHVAVSLAKIYAGQAATFVAKEALQVHGAIGYTIECDLHMWMKRAWALAATHGDAAYHRERVGRHIL
ncbi:MAG: acyl-CoA dehydrogenase family protein [Polyangiales bacterium]|jgi:alkylation response protein AidB-like acyl-CoA dehydrogenase